MNILLVEDHEDSRVILSSLLIHCGHEVASTGNMQDALRLLDNLRFDVLVSDIGLPDGNGIDLVVEAKKAPALEENGRLNCARAERREGARVAGRL